MATWQASVRSNSAESAQAAALATASSQKCAAYLPAFGFLAENNELWSPKHIARVKLEAQPMLEIVVRGHEELGSHTWYILDCAVWRPCLEFARSEWRCYRRLSHLRQGMHDPIKEIMGSAYEHFSATPFAGLGGRSGTTARLRSWCQTLCRCINAAEAPPLVAAITLQLLAAPSKDVAMIALARTCQEDDPGDLGSISNACVIVVFFLAPTVRGFAEGSWISFEWLPRLLEPDGSGQWVRFNEAASVLLEVWADCLGNTTTASTPPFAQACQSFGRLAQVTGAFASDELPLWECAVSFSFLQASRFTVLRPSVSYELILRLAENGNLASNADNSWMAQLWQQTPASNVSETSGPSAKEMLLPLYGNLVPQMPQDRLLVIDTTWLETKGLVVGVSEAAVLLSDGRFGKTAAAALRNAPADDRPRPISRAELQELVYKTNIGGYRLAGATAAFGVGARLSSQSDFTSFVAGMQLGFATSLRLASIRVSAPPHFIFSCDELEPGNTRLADASAPLPCRVLASPFESAIFLQGPRPGGPSGYAAGMHWWFGGLVRVDFQSGWPEERQHWEVELSDDTGDLRLAASPRTAPGLLEAWLLEVELSPSFTGIGDTTFADLHFSIRFFDPLDSNSVPPQEIWNASTGRLQLFLQGPSSVPFDRAEFAEGSCIEAGADIFFPDDSYLGRPPADCTHLRLDRQLQDLTEAAATSVAPRRLKGQLRMALTLTSMCRQPMPPCADFFSLQLGQEQPLYARDHGLARQLAAGQIGTEQAMSARIQAWKHRMSVEHSKFTSPQSKQTCQAKSLPNRSWHKHDLK
ncbi:unnamed protein product [Symbiodinium pilosum]|uniref:Uncharacterized protein n=1 Tax=Symbiodinium pilosum TaxID=2952 RepID=A0A812W3Z1_SYMPI|nr:unnamed protein product [Symbiodinium pilosum]